MTLKNLWDIFTDKYSLSIFHPQYFVKRYENSGVKLAEIYAKGIVVDIGCGRMPYKKRLGHIKKYIGVDSPVTSKWYNSQNKPDIIADATHIPLQDRSCDTILSLQVLEHLPDPQEALNEMKRLLKRNGILILSTVQTYPLHDDPHDYYRFTKFGLKKILTKAGFRIIRHEEQGNIFVLLCQATNIFLMLQLKYMLEQNYSRYLAILLLPFVLIFTTLFNLITLPVSKLEKKSKFRMVQTLVDKKVTP